MSAFDNNRNWCRPPKCAKLPRPSRALIGFSRSLASASSPDLDHLNFSLQTILSSLHIHPSCLLQNAEDVSTDLIEMQLASSTTNVMVFAAASSGPSGGRPSAGQQQLVAHFSPSRGVSLPRSLRDSPAPTRRRMARSIQSLVPLWTVRTRSFC